MAGRWGSVRWETGQTMAVSSCAGYYAPERRDVNRMVRIMIVDPDEKENLPLDRRIVFKSDEFFTDSTDEELLTEVPLADIVKAHNAYRTTVPDRKLTRKMGRDIFLEPIRLRDLIVRVMTVTEF